MTYISLNNFVTVTPMESCIALQLTKAYRGLTKSSRTTAAIELTPDDTELETNNS